MVPIPSAKMPLERWLYFEECGPSDSDVPTRQFVVRLDTILTWDEADPPHGHLLLCMDLRPIQKDRHLYAGAWRDPDKLSAAFEPTDFSEASGSCVQVFRGSDPDFLVEAEASMVPPGIHASGCRPGIVAINQTGFEWKEADGRPSLRFNRQ